jgi:hypothetical protein
LSSRLALDEKTINEKKRKVEQIETTEDQESEKYEKNMKEKALKKIVAASVEAPKKE